eukprot:jgi/Ulvmu1/5264/UM022_0058.1
MIGLLDASQPASGAVLPAEDSGTAGFYRSQAMQEVLEGDPLLHTLASHKASMPHAEQRAAEVIDGLWDLDHARHLEALQSRLQHQQDDAAQLRHENAQIRTCCNKVTSCLLSLALDLATCSSAGMLAGIPWSGPRRSGRARADGCHHIRANAEA